MFHSHKNKQFIFKQVLKFLSDPDIIVKNINPPRPLNFCVAFSRRIPEYKTQIISFLDDEFEDYIPKTRDHYDNHMFSQDEVFRAKYKFELLKKHNREFIITAVKGILQSPDSLFEDFYEYDPETGEHNFKEYAYSNSSFSDGTWHPEHLFTESLRNKQVTYHQDLNVTTDSNPNATGIGHRYNRQMYTSMNQFPNWQFSGDYRPYDRSGEGFREGGDSDRRYQRNRGYNYEPELMARTDSKYNLRSYYVKDLPQLTGYKFLPGHTN